MQTFLICLSVYLMIGFICYLLVAGAYHRLFKKINRVSKEVFNNDATPKLKSVLQKQVHSKQVLFVFFWPIVLYSFILGFFKSKEERIKRVAEDLRTMFDE